MQMKLAIAGGTGLVGRHVVAAAEAQGHEVTVLSRSLGVDVVTGDGLTDALTGVQTIVDVTNSPSQDEQPATDFFVAAAGNLQRVGAQCGVEHIVTLSIVGIDELPTGYYAAKLAHERVAAAGPVPATILRATQFHEFPAQMIGWAVPDGVAHLPDLTVQTVAARTVAEVLVELAGAQPIGRAADLAGPDERQLIDLARTFVARRGREIVVEPDVRAGIPPRALMPGAGARVEPPSFEEWLDGADAAALAL
jgi:uncharacterized protein YbjT (DUF2867 family)